MSNARNRATYRDAELKSSSKIRNALVVLLDAFVVLALPPVVAMAIIVAPV